MAAGRMDTGEDSPWAEARAALPESWRATIGAEFDTPYMRALAGFLQAEAAAGKTVFPEPERIFAALKRTPLDAVKAVILGQDPYHRPGQAMGLSFSVPPGVRVPPSLRNIHKELEGDLGLRPPPHGCLTAWADAGVLLLNTALTVEEGRPGSHARSGWHRFTDHVLAAVNARARSHGLHPLGQRCTAAGALAGWHPAPAPPVGAPLAAFRLSRLLRLPTLFQGQRLPGVEGAGARGLAPGAV